MVLKYVYNLNDCIFYTLIGATVAKNDCCSIKSSHYSKRSIPPNILRATPNQDGKVARLDNILHLRIPQAQVFNLDGNMHRNSLASRNEDLLEPLQLTVRNNNRSNLSET